VSVGFDPLLRRPISVADVEGDRIRLVFRVVGRGTAILSRVRKGDDWDVLGPLGKPAPRFESADVVICGGGVGIAPLLFFVRRLKRARVRVFLGAKTREQLMLVREFRGMGVPVKVATDDGSAGRKATVTELAADDCRLQIADCRLQNGGRRVVVVACGPKPMLADLVRRFDPVPVWGFVEERMGCGTGICYCCALPKKGGGYVRFCQDGPVVLLNEVRL
jgi:dihydroorotate dehydrogenase electron transfer subunit